MFNSMLREYTINNHHKIKRFIRPLEDNFGVKHFCYYSVQNDGNYHFMGSNVSFLEYFYSEKLYVNCPYLLHPSNYQSGTSLSKSIPDSKFQASQNETTKIFEMNIGLTVIEKNPLGIQGFGFAFDHNNPHWESLCINELPLLKHFIKGFKNEFKSTIQKLNDNSINISQLENHPFSTKKMEVLARVKDREELLKKMGIEVPFHLTHTEKEVAKMLAKGHTAKEIGILLDRSRRTIESYIEVLKDSFFCSSKSELTLKAQELANLGYFQ